MTKPQVTIESLIAKWKDIADQNSITTIADEMDTFFSEAREANIPAQDVLKNKDRIIKIWIESNWSDAQQRHPTWKKKEWWSERRAKVIKMFGERHRDFYANAEPEKQEKSEKDYFSHMPLFTNVEDLMKWKAKRSSNI